MTRKLFDTQSDTQDAERPKAAERTRNKSRSSSLEITGSLSFKKLNVRNQGKLHKIAMCVWGDHLEETNINKLCCDYVLSGGGCCSARHCSLIQRGRSAFHYFLSKSVPTIRTFHLQNSFTGVNRHEKNAPYSSRHTSHCSSEWMCKLMSEADQI